MVGATTAHNHAVAGEEVVEPRNNKANQGARGEGDKEPAGEEPLIHSIDHWWMRVTGIP